MTLDNYYQRVGREFVERAGVPIDEYEDHLEGIGRAMLSAGGHSPTGVQAYRAVDDHIAEREILPRLTDDLIEEHAEQPIGQQSDDLQRVLRYFRRRPVEGKRVLVETEKNERWCVGLVTEQRGPVEVTDECYESPEAAEHAIFKQRVEEFRERFGEGS